MWAVVSDPESHPDWWPDVVDVRTAGPVGEGGEYVRVSRRMGFLDEVDAVWVVERLENLKEAHFRCTISGSYARFSLTPAREDTFVEVESGMLPTNLRWRVARAISQGWFKRWLRDVLDALPNAVSRARRSS